jgi:uncharacterized protein
MRREPIAIHKDQDFYVPTFEVKVSKRQLESETIHDITQVTYKDDINAIDTFEITINNWDAEARTFKYSDGPLFDPGQTVELYIGYFGRGALRLMLTGKITSLRPSFPRGGMPTLAISGLNVLHDLRRRQTTHRYENMTDNEIARQIAGRLGMRIHTDEGGAGQQQRYDYVLQDNEYDIMFLMQRARRIGYDLFVKEQSGGASELYFGASGSAGEPIYELHYGRSLIEFQPDLSTANQTGRVCVQSWDPVRKRAIRECASRDQIRTVGLGGSGQRRVERAFNDREEVITDSPANTPQEAQIRARETLERIAKNMLKGSGSVVGLPAIRAGTVLHLSGLGKRFSGRYFVTSTTHTINDSGYTTEFQCRREEVRR